MDIGFCHSHSSECLARLWTIGVIAVLEPPMVHHPANWCGPGLERCIQQSVECLKWQVLAFKCRYMITLHVSAWPTQHTTKAQLVNQQCQDLRAIIDITDQQPVCFSLRCQRGSQGGESWFRWPPAKGFFRLASSALIETVEFRGKVTHNYQSSSLRPAYLWFFFLLAALQLQHVCNCFYLFGLSSSK